MLAFFGRTYKTGHKVTRTSFAEKAVLEFEPGITAIVGPNGSGKSNITDAILWVLGEQSPRSLRGSSMEDVIFAGSSVKSPLGIAEVSLCLDNSDKSIPIEFSEVIVSRRVLRSGESEYRINNTPCRLIDIFELLSDTGLGREMHSVVSQGKVEEVLNCRPEERRMLIDEAANVLKYRKRKEKAARKIISVEEKLIRIKDILREIRQQLNPLRRQAREAEVFNQLSLELKNLEINLTVVELKELQLSWDAVSQQEDELNNQIIKLKEALKKEEEELKALKEKMSEIDFSTDNLRDHIGRLENIREQLNGNILLVKEKVKNFEISLEKVLNEKNNLKAVLEKRFFEISKIQEDKKQIEEKIKIVCDNLNSKEETLVRLKCKIEETRLSFSKIQIELVGYREESNRCGEKLNSLSNTIIELNSRLSVLKVKEEDIVSRKKEAEREFLVKENEKKRFDSELDNLKNSMADCRKTGVFCPNIDDVERIKNHFALSSSNLLEKTNELNAILNEKNELIEKLNAINDDKINFENKLMNLKEKIKWLEEERGNHERIRNQFLR
ncbi:MAG: AAA family ATPase [Actinobacteria bacterium]|nr:AAA family ATPase [Actinomycetota bacterium]